jgi:hypothetical protein
MTRKYLLIISIFLLLVLMVACEPFLVQSPPVNGTQTAFDKMVNQTVTARFIQQGSSGGELSTAFANATALSQTITAQAQLNGSTYPETATAAFPVLEELRHYGVSPFDGNIAWLHRPVTITLKGPNQFGYANDYPQITARDFVLAADINWNTKLGLAGCGFMFRSDGNKAGPNQLMVIISRSAEGTAIYSAMVGGKVINYQEYYPWTKDRSFNWQNDSVNRLVIVARDNLIDIYTNGALVTEVDTTKPPPATVNKPVVPTLSADHTAQQLSDYQQMLRQYQGDNNQIYAQSAEAQRNFNSNKLASLSEGFLAFAASSSSGTAECKFNNSWLFLFNQGPSPTPTITPTYNGTEAYNTTLTTMMPAIPFNTPNILPTITFIITQGPTSIPTDVPTATQPPVPTATQPPVPTATQPPVPTATQPPVTQPPATQPPATP